MLRILTPDTAMHALVCLKVRLASTLMCRGFFLLYPQKSYICYDIRPSTLPVYGLNNGYFMLPPFFMNLFPLEIVI